MLAPPAPEKAMSWPLIDGSLAAIDNGLCAPGTPEPTPGLAAATGDADGLAAAAGFGETAGDAAGLAMATGDEAAAGLAVGAAAEVGAAAGCAVHPSASSSVAVEPTPPVMFNTRLTRSRRDRYPAR